MKILYVTTISNTVNAFLIPHIQMLIQEGHKVDVAFNIEQEVSPELKKMGCKIYSVLFQRTPLSRDNLKAYKSIKNIIEIENYDVVHTHTPVASAIVRYACRNTDVKVYYTAHGFHFYERAPLINWLTFYLVERYLSRYTDTLITINEEDYNRAKKFSAARVEYVPGVGVNIRKIKNLNVKETNKREELGIPEESFLLLSVGELNENKNHESVIRALSQINNAEIHYAICGQGNLKEKLQKLSLDLGVEKQVHFLGFRTDVTTIYSISDLFIFPSYREGLSVSLMEAMASGLPVIASNIRGNNDLVDHERGGYLIYNKEVDEYATRIMDCYQDEFNTDLFGSYNQEKIQKYSIENVLELMKEIYN